MNLSSAICRSGTTDIRMLRLALLTTSAFGAAVAACPAAAQAVPAASDEIVVTAQKRAEPLQKVPINISVLDGKDLDKQAAGGVLEALQSTPSVSGNTSDLGGVTQISIRGVAPAVPFGLTSSTVGYYIDGVPFALGRSAGVPNAGDFDLSRIEVLRGPQGTLYGASALNGVVQIVTNEADPTGFDAKARLGTGTTKGGGVSYLADAAINVPLIKDVLAIRLTGGFNHDAGWVDQPLLNKRNANWTDNAYIRAKLDFRPTDNLKIDIGAWLSSIKEGAPSFNEDGVQRRTVVPIPSKVRFGAYNAKIVYDLPFASITSSTSYLRFRQDVSTNLDNALTPAPTLPVPPEARRLYSRLPARVFTEEFVVNSANSTNLRWQVGAFYRDAQNDTFQTLPVAFGPGNNTSFRDSSESYAFFGQATYAFADGRFEVTGGLRYFHDRYRTQTLVNPNNILPVVDVVNTAKATTPRFVVAWLPNKDTNIYATYSVGFRSGVNQNPLSIAVNPAFAPAGPDKLHNYEFGAKGRLGGGLITYDLSVFYIDWKAVQQGATVQFCSTPSTCVPVGAVINGTSASGAGFDLSLGLNPVRGLNIGGTFSSNGLEQDEDILIAGPGTPPSYFAGDRLAFSPKYTASAFLNYSWALSDDLNARYDVSATYRSASSQVLAPGDYAALNGLDFTECNITGTNVNRCYDSGKPFSLDMRLEISNNREQSISLYATNITNWQGTTIPDFSDSTQFRPRPRTFGIQLASKF